MKYKLLIILGVIIIIFSLSIVFIPKIKTTAQDLVGLKIEKISRYDTTMSDCATLGSAGQTYLLTSDIIDYSETVCINITANNIVLDCQGHIINSDGTFKGAFDYGVYSNNTLNLTIKNCFVSDVLNGYAIAMYNVTTGVMDNDTLFNDDEGIFFFNSSGFNITNSNFTLQDSGALHIAGSSNIFVNSTYFYDSNYGIKIGEWNSNFGSNFSFNNITMKDNIDYFAGGYLMQNINITNSLFNDSKCLLGTGDSSSILDISSDAGDVLIINTSIYGCSNTGIKIEALNSEIYINNLTLKNMTYGVDLSNEGNNTLINSKISDCSTGVWIGSSDNNFYNNFLNNSKNMEVGVSSCSGMVTDCSSSSVTDLCNMFYEGDFSACCPDYGCSDAGSSCSGTTYKDCSEDIGCFEGFSECVYSYGTNYFNTTNQTGTRTYSNGTKIGGNYYSNITGGFSSTCTDTDKDGFCDSIFDIRNNIFNNSCINNCDYLAYSDDYERNYLTITSPTTSSPLNVTAGDNISIYFNVTIDNSTDYKTTGVTVNNVTINGNLSNICTYASTVPISNYHNTTAVRQNITHTSGSLVTTWAKGWTTADVTTSEVIYNVSLIDSKFYQVRNLTAGSNFDLLGTFNFTITEPIATITSIEVWTRATCVACDVLEYLNSEIANFSSLKWENISTNTTANYTSATTITNTYNGNLTNIIKDGQLVLAIQGLNLDPAAEYINVEYVQIRVNSTNISSGQNFTYIPNVGWQVNVTIPADSTGYKDLFVNATYSGTTYNQTQTNAINYTGGEPPANSCTCPSTNTNWVIAMIDYCNITSACNIGTGNLSFTGAGYCNFSNTITANKKGNINLTNGATIYLYKTGGIINLV